MTRITKFLYIDFSKVLEWIRVFYSNFGLKSRFFFVHKTFKVYFSFKFEITLEITLSIWCSKCLNARLERLHLEYLLLRENICGKRITLFFRTEVESNMCLRFHRQKCRFLADIQQVRVVVWLWQTLEGQREMIFHSERQLPEAVIIALRGR